MFEENEFEVLVGTYEDYIVGYRVEPIAHNSIKKLKRQGKLTQDQLFSLEQSFAVRGHSGSVKCLASSASGTLVSSSGFDEVTNMFNLKKRKLQHTIEIAANCSAFVEDTHVIFGCEDGNINIYEINKGTLELAKILKGHKGPVTSMSVHPTGKVLLSISKDLTMRTWNLIKGRCAYVTNLGAQAHLVSWSKTGEDFVLAANNEVYLYNKEGNLEHSIKLKKRINSVEFITNNNFMVASDSGDLEFFDLKDGKSLMKFAAHEARVKSVKCIRHPSSSTTMPTDQDQNQEPSDVNVHFATASSDGIVKLWSMSLANNSTGKQLEKPIELANVDTGARLTCLTAVVRKLEAC